MVVSKNKTMKLGAALMTAGLGITATACDGDTPGNPCDLTVEQLVGAAYLQCDSFDGEEIAYFNDIYLDGDGTGTWDFFTDDDEWYYDITWEAISSAGDDDCEISVDFFKAEDDEALDFTYILSEIEIDGDTITMHQFYEGGEEPDTNLDLTCEVVTPD